MCLGDTAPLQAETRVNAWVSPTCEKAGAQASGWSLPPTSAPPSLGTREGSPGKKWVVPTPPYDLESAEGTALEHSLEKEQTGVLGCPTAGGPGDML